MTPAQQLDCGEEYDRYLANKVKSAAWDKFVAMRGSRYADCQLRNFEVTSPEQQKVIRQLKDFVLQHLLGSNQKQKAEIPNLLFTGPKGTGKDHLMVAMVYTAIRSGIIKVQWRNGAQLFSALRSGIVDEIAERQLLWPLMDCDLLCLSDICQSGSTLSDYQRQILYQVLDHRYSADKPTWLTINVTGRQELEAMITPHLADRLIDGAVVVTCNWPSYRQVAKEGSAND